MADFVSLSSFIGVTAEDVSGWQFNARNNKYWEPVKKENLKTTAQGLQERVMWPLAWDGDSSDKGRDKAGKAVVFS
jgi:hypothetical protein